MTHHFIASSASTMLNSRANLAVYVLSEKSDGRTAAPILNPKESARSRSDWAAHGTIAMQPDTSNARKRNVARTLGGPSSLGSLERGRSAKGEGHDSL